MRNWRVHKYTTNSREKLCVIIKVDVHENPNWICYFLFSKFMGIKKYFFKVINFEEMNIFLASVCCANSETNIWTEIKWLNNRRTIIISDHENAYFAWQDK